MIALLLAIGPVLFYLTGGVLSYKRTWLRREVAKKREAIAEEERRDQWHEQHKAMGDRGRGYVYVPEKTQSWYHFDCCKAHAGASRDYMDGPIYTPLSTFFCLLFQHFPHSAAFPSLFWPIRLVGGVALVGFRSVRWGATHGPAAAVGRSVRNWFHPEIPLPDYKLIKELENEK